LRRADRNHTLNRPPIIEEDGPMCRATRIAAAIAATIMLLAAAPAYAGYGAVALDEGTGKYGISWNEPTQARANELALKGCNSSKCKVVFPILPGQCGAVATGEKGTAWGGAVKVTIETAEFSALEDCQKHTAGKCILRESKCDHR
jgi:hypothetical protein